MFRIIALCLCATLCHAQTMLESLDEALTLSNADGSWRADVSGLIDLELYAPEMQALGLVETDDELFFNPRLTLQFDLQEQAVDLGPLARFQEELGRLAARSRGLHFGRGARRY